MLVIGAARTSQESAGRVALRPDHSAGSWRRPTMTRTHMRRDVTLAALVLSLAASGGCGSSSRGVGRRSTLRPDILASTARPVAKPVIAHPAGVLQQLPAIPMGPVHVGAVGF
jgi:hypothetical protein